MWSAAHDYAPDYCPKQGDIPMTKKQMEEQMSSLKKLLEAKAEGGPDL